MSKAADALSGRTITTSGKGTITASPDIAQISIGVTSTARTAAAALKANSQDMHDVIAVLKGAGIAPRDIQTSNLSVNPRQQHFRDGRPPKVTGYQVSNQLLILARELDRLGDILDRVVSVGANQIHGISFQVSNNDKLKDLARGEAIEDARRKAELYARAAGAAVGPIVTIAEQGSGGSRPAMAMTRTVQSAAPPIERGSLTLQVRVTATWELQ